MPQLSERDLRPLAQAVVCGDEEQDAQAGPRNGGGHRGLPAQSAGATTQDLVELDGTAHEEVRRPPCGPPVYAWTNALPQGGGGGSPWTRLTIGRRSLRRSAHGPSGDEDQGGRRALP